MKKDKDLRLYISKINNITRILNTKPDPEDIFDEVVKQIAIELDCSHCSLYFPKRKNGCDYLEPKATWPKVDGEKVKKVFKCDEGLIGIVYSDKKSRIFSDAANHPNFVKGLSCPKYHQRSMLISPIMSGNSIIGLICADQDQLDWFTEEDLLLVDSLAINIGAAFDRSLVYKALKRISDTLIETLNPERMDFILETVLKTAVDLTAASTGVIYLLAEDKTTILESKTYPRISIHQPPRRDSSGNFNGITREIITLKHGLYIENADQDERVNPVLREKIKSMAAFPLLAQNEVIGLFFLDDTDTHQYTQIEKIVLETLVNQVGTAISSFRLIKKLETRELEYYDLFAESVKARDGISSKMFYADISHSVKNVLAQIDLRLDIIKDNLSNKLSNNQRDRFIQLKSEIEKNIANIENFLDLASEPEDEKNTCKISTLINYSVNLLEGKIRSNDILVDVSRIDNNLQITVSRTQIIMVFINLIDNAIDALAKVNGQKELRIYTRSDDKSPWIEIIFEDTGSGITSQNMEKLFEPFFSTKSKRGRGIGLLGSRRIIEKHKGKLPHPISDIRKGTKFIVYLPKK